MLAIAAIPSGLKAGERIVTSANSDRFGKPAKSAVAGAAAWPGKACIRRRSQTQRSGSRGSAVINRVIEFSARNKFVVFLLVGFACAWGDRSGAHAMPLDAIWIPATRR